MRKSSRLMMILTSLAGAGLAQTFHGEFSDSYCDHRLCRMYGSPCEDRYTMRVPDCPPGKKSVELKPEEKLTDPDPLEARLSKRMEVIGGETFVNTNTIPINMAPGL